MPTFDSFAIIKTMLRNDGNYSDETGSDPQACSIWSYTNAWGKRAWYVNYKSEILRQTDHVIFPIMLWSQYRGLTAQGKEALNEQP